MLDQEKVVLPCEHIVLRGVPLFYRRSMRLLHLAQLFTQGLERCAIFSDCGIHRSMLFEKFPLHRKQPLFLFACIFGGGFKICALLLQAFF